MGAVPGGCFLSDRGIAGGGGPGDSEVTVGGDVPPSSWVDVDQYRTSDRRVVVYEVTRPVLVLGSTQSPSVVDRRRAAGSGVAVVRRRSGGGAVYLEPGAQEWVDVWIPRHDPCWSPEPRATAERVGEWWARALGGTRAATATATATATVEVHRGAPVPTAGERLVCFAGIGAGEVVLDGRKLVGLAQWRSREGALVHGCAYRRWDPRPILDLLAIEGSLRRLLEATLSESVVALRELGGAPWHSDQLVAALPPGAPWQVGSAQAPSALR